MLQITPEALHAIRTTLAISDDRLRRRLAAERARRSHRELNKGRLEVLIDEAAEILRTGEPTKFQLEGTCRHGLRSALVLQGWRWAEADAAAVDVVSRALKRIGASRPSWLQGQTENRERDQANFRSRLCQNCGGILDFDHRGNFCSEHCSTHVRQRRWVRENREQINARTRIWRAANPDRVKQIRQRNQDRWETCDCKTCGKPFKARPGREARYCSQECYAAPNQKAQPDQACVQCGSMFRDTKAGSTKRYCSTACYYEWRKEETTRKNERQCPNCLTVFGHSRTRHSQVYCSKSCGAAARRNGPARPILCEAVIS